MAEIVMCGGSVVGLATAMMLARDGDHVTVLEGDGAAPPMIRPKRGGNGIARVWLSPDRAQLLRLVG